MGVIVSLSDDEHAGLERAYAEAFEEWDASDDLEAWEAVVGDGLA